MLRLENVLEIENMKGEKEEGEEKVEWENQR